MLLLNITLVIKMGTKKTKNRNINDELAVYVLVGGMQVKYTSVLKFLKEKSKNLGSNIRLKTEY